MSEKNESEREAFGPRVAKTQSVRHGMKFRVDPLLFKKLGALAEIETRVAKLDDPASRVISDNAQLHYILESFIGKYEKKYGALPSTEDADTVEQAIQRHVRARKK